MDSGKVICLRAAHVRYKPMNRRKSDLNSEELTTQRLIKASISSELKIRRGHLMPPSSMCVMDLPAPAVRTSTLARDRHRDNVTRWKHNVSAAGYAVRNLRRHKNKTQAVNTIRWLKRRDVVHAAGRKPTVLGVLVSTAAIDDVPSDSGAAGSRLAAQQVHDAETMQVLEKMPSPIQVR